MKRKNTILTTIKRELHTWLMKFMMLAWIIGMGSFAIFVLLMWSSLD